MRENQNPEPEQSKDNSPSPPSAPPTPPPSDSGPSREIEEGKVFAILCYAFSLLGFAVAPFGIRFHALAFAGIPFFLIPLIMRNNEFSLYHAKQCLMLWLAGIVLAAVCVPLVVMCIGLVLLPVGSLVLLTLNIIGLINAINSAQKPLPIIGRLAEEWFKGLRKV